VIEIQRKRIHSNTSQLAALGVNNLVYTINESNGVNVHGMRLSAGWEPQDADANAHIIWSLICMPDEVAPIPNLTQGLLELEGSNAFIWACGVKFMSNQTPANLDLVINTSRNCQNGARIVFQHFIEGLTAGQLRCVKLMQCFTKSL